MPGLQRPIFGLILRPSRAQEVHPRLERGHSKVKSAKNNQFLFLGGGPLDQGASHAKFHPRRQRSGCAPGTSARSCPFSLSRKRLDA